MQISEANGVFEYAYEGEKGGYNLKINLSGSSFSDALFANYGSSGCQGIITEISTGRSEKLKFFCEEYNDDYTLVTCYVGLGEEVIFDRVGNENYVVHYCSDDKQKTLRFNIADCEKCHCTMYWYEGEIRKQVGRYDMACKQEEDKAHCFTYYGYEAWRDFLNQDDDFKQCVGLDF